MATDSKNIRNVIMLGHSQSGKTSLVEQILVNGGTISRAGSVDKGDTVCDYNEDEIQRKISINSALCFVKYKDYKINIIDTPGYNDFIGEVLGGMRAADAAVIVVNAASGVEVGTEKFFKITRKANIPTLIFINKMEKEYADFNKCMEQIVKKFGKGCVCVTCPDGDASSFKAIANLITKDGMGNLGDERKKLAETLYGALCESVAESDDALLEKYLEKGELSNDEISGAFKKGVLERTVIPVLSGSALTNIGVKELMDFIINDFPSPIDRKPIDGLNLSNSQPVTIDIKTEKMFSAQVFKTISDPYMGQISAIRVFSGAINSNATVVNTSNGTAEKLGQIFMLNGKKDVQQDSLQAGDIGCVAKLKSTNTSDTLADQKFPVKINPINFPEAAISFSIKPKSRGDEDKISAALHKLVAEDNSFKTNRDPQTRELIISGMGDLHLTIMINRLAARYGVHVDIGTPKVAYKETILSKGDAQYRHKKQSGGAGQFAEVWLKVEPMTRGKGFEFSDEVVGGSIPGPFVVSCEKGIKVALDTGVLAGFPVVDVKAIVYDGKTHPVDSKDIAFQIAARHAFKEACLKAKPVILEPIMDVEVIIPEEYMGDITGSLNQRRGRIVGMEPGEGAETIKAQVPLEEMYKYVNELKSLTAGRGTYTMKFSHYEVVPSNIAQNIIINAQKHKVEEKEE